MTKRIRLRYRDDGNLAAWQLLAVEYDIVSYGVAGVFDIQGDDTMIPLFLNEARRFFEFRELPNH